MQHQSRHARRAAAAEESGADLEMEDEGSASRRGWAVLVSVTEFVPARGIGAGIALVRVRGEDTGGGGKEEVEEEGKGWVLIGNGVRNDSEEVASGCMVGLRRPVWDIDVLGCRWGVGIDWAVLS